MLGAVRGGRFKLKEGKGVSYWRIGGNGRQQWQVCLYFLMCCVGPLALQQVPHLSIQLVGPWDGRCRLWPTRGQSGSLFERKWVEGEME